MTDHRPDYRSIMSTPRNNLLYYSAFVGDLSSQAVSLALGIASLPSLPLSLISRIGLNPATVETLP